MSDKATYRAVPLFSEGQLKNYTYIYIVLNRIYRDVVEMVRPYNEWLVLVLVNSLLRKWIELKLM